jgi:hypothetical protein
MAPMHRCSLQSSTSRSKPASGWSSSMLVIVLGGPLERPVPWLAPRGRE